MDYNKFLYLFPPRPETKASQASISMFERLKYLGQPKLNGSCSLLFMNETQTIFMNRHKDTFAKVLIPDDEFRKLYRGTGWMVLVGEYMNKSQKDTKKKIFNGKFVIFDILVFNSQHLLETTIVDRISILDDMYKLKVFDGWINQIEGSDLLYRVISFFTNLEALWLKIIEFQMYEGFVFKRITGKLENGFKKENNMTWQAKVRKETKNYNY